MPHCTHGNSLAPVHAHHPAWPWGNPARRTHIYTSHGPLYTHLHGPLSHQLPGPFCTHCIGPSTPTCTDPSSTTCVWTPHPPTCMALFVSLQRGCRWKRLTALRAWVVPGDLRDLAGHLLGGTSTCIQLPPEAGLGPHPGRQRGAAGPVTQRRPPTTSTCPTPSSGSSGAPGGWETAGVRASAAPRSRTMPEFCMACRSRFSWPLSPAQLSSSGPEDCKGNGCLDCPVCSLRNLPSSTNPTVPTSGPTPFMLSGSSCI